MSYTNNSTNRRAKSAAEIALRARATERELSLMVAKYANEKKAPARKANRASKSLVTSVLASFRLI